MSRLWEVSGSMSKKQNIDAINPMWEIFELNKPQKNLKCRMTNQKKHNIQDKTSCINGWSNEMLENNNARKHEISRWVYRWKDGDICLTVSVPAVSVYKIVRIIW